MTYLTMLQKKTPADAGEREDLGFSGLARSAPLSYGAV